MSETRDEYNRRKDREDAEWFARVRKQKAQDRRELAQHKAYEAYSAPWFMSEDR